MRVGRAALPVLGERDETGLSVCPLNFRGIPLASVDADCLLDLETVDLTLATLNAVWCEERGQDRLARTALRALLLAP